MLAAPYLSLMFLRYTDLFRYQPRRPEPAHSVLTKHLIDEAGEPTREALERTLSFLREHLAAGSARLQ